MRTQIPSKLTIVLSGIAGILTAFVAAHIIELPAEWSQAVQLALTFTAGLGISPLTGSSFRSVLHLGNGAANAIAAVLAAAQVVVVQAAIGSALHGILAGIIAFAAGLGFAPSLSFVSKTGRTTWL
jgi:hypothetical protein